MALPNQIPENLPAGLNEDDSFDRRLADTSNNRRERSPTDSPQPGGSSDGLADLNNDDPSNVHPEPDPSNEDPAIDQPVNPPTTEPEKVPAGKFRKRMQRWKDNRKLWWDIFQYFCWNVQPDENHWLTRAMSTSKLPGLKQAVKKDMHLMTRIAWTSEFMIMLGGSLSLIYLGIVFLLNHPVETSVEPTEVALHAVTFPGFTVKSTRNSFELMKKDALQLYAKVLFTSIVKFGGDEWEENGIGQLLFVLDHLEKTYRGHSTFLKDRLVKKESAAYQKWIKILRTTVKINHDDGTFKKILRFMLSYSQNCSDMITDLTVKGRPMKTSTLFKLVFTDMGFGCSANRILDQILMKEKDIRWMTSEFMSESGDITEEIKRIWMLWEYNREQIFDENGKAKPRIVATAESKNKIPQTPEEEIATEFPIPFFQDVPGPGNGIIFKINSPVDESNRAFSTYDGVGHIISFHHPLDMATMTENAVAIETKKEYFLELIPEIRLTDIDIKNVSPDKKQCNSKDDVKLRYFVMYTENNCHMECLANLTIGHCKCASISLPHPVDVPLCSAEQMRCVDHVLESVYVTESITECQPCYSLCNVVKYGVQISSLNYIDSDEEKSGDETEDIGNHTTVRKTKSSGLVRIFFGKRSYPATVKISKINPTEVAGILGGILSGTFGFSLHSVTYILQALYIVFAQLATFLFILFSEKLFSIDFWKKFFKGIGSWIVNLMKLIWGLICEILGFVWDGLCGAKDYVGACCFYMFQGQLQEEQQNRPNRNIRVVNQPRGDVEQPGGRPLQIAIWHPLDIGRRARVVTNNEEYGRL